MDNVIKILNVSAKNLNKTIKIIVKAVKDGKVLILPTDTVYGLICDATNKKAVARLFRIKKRPKSRPIPIFVKDISSAKKLVEINENQAKFLKKVWPGKTTAVLKLKIKNSIKIKNWKLKIYGVFKDTIALRIPKNKLVLGLLKKTKKPLTGTSANISGKPASIKIKEILKQFENQKEQPDLVIDAGDLPESKPSKVFDLTISPPKILRK